MGIPSPQAYRNVRNIHRIGLAADRPVASDVLYGTLYFSTDTGVIERSNGLIWEPYSSAGTLPSNIAYVDAPNVFTENQYIVRSGQVILDLMDTSQPADSRKYRIYNISQLMVFDAVNDAETTQDGYMYLNRSGDLTVKRDLYEKLRSTPVGHWQDISFNAASYVGSSGMVWTVGSAAVVRNRYAMVGKTFFWSFCIVTYAGSNVLSVVGGPNLTISTGISGLTFLNDQVVPIDRCQGMTGISTLAGLYALPIGNTIVIYRPGGGNFALADIPGLTFTAAIEIA